MESLTQQLAQVASLGPNARYSHVEMNLLVNLVAKLHSHLIVVTKRVSVLEKLRKRSDRGDSNSVASKRSQSKSKDDKKAQKAGKQSPERGRSMRKRSTSPVRAGQSISRSNKRSKSTKGLFKGMSVQQKEILKKEHKYAYKKVPKDEWQKLSHEDKVVQSQRRKAAIAEYKAKIARMAEVQAEKKKALKEESKMEVQDSKDSAAHQKIDTGPEPGSGKSDQKINRMDSEDPDPYAKNPQLQKQGGGTTTPTRPRPTQGGTSYTGTTGGAGLGKSHPSTGSKPYFN